MQLLFKFSPFLLEARQSYKGNALHSSWIVQALRSELPLRSFSPGISELRIQSLSAKQLCYKSWLAALHLSSGLGTSAGLAGHRLGEPCSRCSLYLPSLHNSLHQRNWTDN